MRLITFKKKIQEKYTKPIQIHKDRLKIFYGHYLDHVDPKKLTQEVSVKKKNVFLNKRERGGLS